MTASFVIDPFGGTGTTLRVCKALKIACTCVEISENYCRRMADENDVKLYQFQDGRIKHAG